MQEAREKGLRLFAPPKGAKPKKPQHSITTFFNSQPREAQAQAEAATQPEAADPPAADPAAADPPVADPPAADPRIRIE